jgi:hypothetical protein
MKLSSFKLIGVTIIICVMIAATSCLSLDSTTPKMMKQYYAAEVEQIELVVGQPIMLESLRESVRPPYLMLLPFIETPPEVNLQEQRALDEDGIHGCTFVLEATKPVDDTLIVGFRDMQTGAITHTKTIHVVAR